MDYVTEKADLYELQKKVKSWERKVEIAEVTNCYNKNISREKNTLNTYGPILSLLVIEPGFMLLNIESFIGLPDVFENPSEDVAADADGKSDGEPVEDDGGCHVNSEQTVCL